MKSSGSITCTREGDVALPSWSSAPLSAAGHQYIRGLDGGEDQGGSGSDEGHRGETRVAELGVEIVRQALKSPARAILDNAGFQGSVVIGRMLEKGTPSHTSGFDAASGETMDFILSGIIDPTKALQSTRSSIGMPTSSHSFWAWFFICRL